MGDYHYVYKDVEGTTTEWDDIQRKLGNLPAKPPKERPPGWEPAAEASSSRKDKEWLDGKTEEELEDLEDDADLDDDRFLEEFRKKRLIQLKAQARKARFGSVIPITGADFIREVSHAPADVWVVVHLYKDGVPECQILGQCLEELAAKYAGSKFVKIVSTDCIKDYPDFNLPTVLVYNQANVKATLIGMHHFGGKKCTAEDVAFSLLQVGPVLTGSGDGDASSREVVTERVRRDFLHRIVTKYEQASSDQSDDDS
eukprot:TRINITY_DN13382_c0_g2_i1.p1 TRINITY_DN13382_c0_g2~~TRINITY_DN13382_c0_g2_i1.p1  ORF type:complete len:256 (+),score=62.66 TRINITY_DN13382_c0_g2_i1:232-999(+)